MITLEEYQKAESALDASHLALKRVSEQFDLCVWFPAFILSGNTKLGPVPWSNWDILEEKNRLDLIFISK